MRSSWITQEPPYVVGLGSRAFRDGAKRPRAHHRMLRGPSTIQRKRRLVAPTSQASYKGGLRSGAEAARRALFAGFGAVDNRGPSVRPRPLYSTRQRSYSASCIPTERNASATGKPPAVSVSII